MSVVRGASVLSVGLAAAACAAMYVAANRPSAVARPSLDCGPSDTTPKRKLGSANELPSLTRRAGVQHHVSECQTRLMQLSLETLCQEKAGRLRRQLGHECQVVVRRPFVLAGDSSPAYLERKYSLTIEPAWRAMARHYLRRAPDRPITVLLFSGEAPYRRYAERLFFDRNVSRFGYFKPGRRTIVANSAWGDGPLLHELTHAMMYFDFPEAAVWLREGLASLHEASLLAGNGDCWTLDGKVNWRLDVLKRQIQAGPLQSLQNLIQTVDFGGPGEAVNCAQARYFCLFLQQKNVLAEVYRRYRASHDEDLRGEKTVLLAFPGHSWQDLDAEFSRWVMSLPSRAGT